MKNDQKNEVARSWAPVAATLTARRVIGATAALLVGCVSPVDTPAEDIEETEELPLNYNPWGLWPGGTVPVCFSQEADIDFSAAEQQTIRQMVRDTWQRAARIQFTGWGACPSQSPNPDMVLIRNCRPTPTSSPVCGPGVSTNGKSTNNYLNLDPQRAIFRGDIVHEFGHILGFNHEHERPEGDDAVNQVCASRVISNGGVPGAGVPGGSVTVGPYDDESIMNYCADAFVFGSGRYGQGYVSEIDVRGARKAYGWRPWSDYDGDGVSDIAIWRPSNGNWFVAKSNGSAFVWSYPYGVAGDIPVRGDFDGDGVMDKSVWRPTAGTYQGYWFSVLSSGGTQSVAWGAGADTPVAGDYDGDGITDTAVWRPSTGTWYILTSSGVSIPNYNWGEAGDIPVPEDYDGDGKTDLAVYRPSGAYAGYWFLALSGAGYTTSSFAYGGVTGDVPVPGDYDGDRKTDAAVYRTTGTDTGKWFVRYANGSGERREVYGGLAGDVPVPSDYTGDGIVDFGIWRPSTGAWHMYGLTTILMGQSGDIPVPRTIRR